MHVTRTNTGRSGRPADRTDRLVRRSRRAAATALVAAGLVLGVDGAASAADPAASGSATGIVSDGSGAPITTGDACVTTLRDGGQVFDQPTRTDDTGRFTVTGLEAGGYTFRVEDCDGSERDDIGATYGATAYDDATTVEVRDGRTSSGIDVRLGAGTRISGRIFGGEGEERPLGSFCAVAKREDGQAVDDIGLGLRASADDEGRYVVRHVPSGEGYVVAFRQCDGFKSGQPWAPVMHGGGTDPDGAEVVSPTTAAPATGVDGHAPPSARLEGSVTAPDGTALGANVGCVEAIPADPTDLFFGNPSTQTDEDGHYAFDGLPAGRYRLRFTVCGPGGPDGVVATYSGGATREADARPVTVATGETASGNDQRLARGTSISGTVYEGSGTGTPASRACVTATPHGDPTGEDRDYLRPFFPTSVADDGSYTVGSLPERAAGWDVRFVTCSFPGGSDRRYAPVYHGGDASPDSSVAVHPTPDAPVTGLTDHVVPSAAIAGTLRDEAGDAIADRCVVATERRSDGRAPFASDAASSDADGHYLLDGLPSGTYRLRAAACPGTSGEGPAPATASEDVAVASGARRDGADIVMPPGGAVRGRAFAGSGTEHPLRSLCVDAFGNDDESPAASAVTTPRGGYTLGGLTVGRPYRIRFSSCDGPGRYATQWFDGAASRADAQAVMPAAGGRIEDVDGHLVRDLPDTTITGGPADGSTTNETDARLTFVSDRSDAAFECSLDDGAYKSCSSPETTGTLSAGAHTFAVRARKAGSRVGRNVDPSPATVTWTVDPAADRSTTKGHVGAGDTFDPDAGRAPSAASPTVAVTMPVPADVSVTKEKATTAAPSGYAVAGRQLTLEATGDDGKRAEGTAADPIAVTFGFAALPEGADPKTFTMLRDGAALQDCAGDATTAAPDPCVAKRTPLADGGLELRVLTTHLSTWNLARAKKTTTPPTGGGGGDTTTPTTTTPAPTTTTTTPGATPAPAPAATTTTTTPAPAAIVHRATFGTARTPRLRKALASGLLVRLRCAGGCGATVRVAVSGAVARRLRLAKAARRTTVARGSRAVTADGTYVRVRFTRKARRALARLRRVSVTVQATPTGPDAGPAVIRRLTLKR